MLTCYFSLFNKETGAGRHGGYRRGDILEVYGW